MSAADEAPAAALTDFIEDWYDRTVDPAHSWVARDLAEAIVEWQASRPITDEEVEAAAVAIHVASSTYDPGVAMVTCRRYARAALEAVRGVQS